MGQVLGRNWGCLLFIFAVAVLALALAGTGDPSTDLLKIVWVVIGG